MTTPSDTQLIEQATNGNRQAFGLLVQRHQAAVRRFLLHQTLGNAALSDDLAQETFLKAYTHLDQYRGGAAFLTWLLRIAYNQFYDHTRKRGRQSAIISRDQASSSSSSSSSDLHMDIYRALALLRDEERLCITLQLVDGYPLADIAQITGMPEGTVKSHLSRGKEKLSTYLKQNGYERK